MKAEGGVKNSGDNGKEIAPNLGFFDPQNIQDLQKLSSVLGSALTILQPDQDYPSKREKINKYVYLDLVHHQQIKSPVLINSEAISLQEQYAVEYRFGGQGQPLVYYEAQLINPDFGFSGLFFAHYRGGLVYLTIAKNNQRDYLESQEPEELRVVEQRFSSELTNIFSQFGMMIRDLYKLLR